MVGQIALTWNNRAGESQSMWGSMSLEIPLHQGDVNHYVNALQCSRII
jgi:hypothetical protein